MDKFSFINLYLTHLIKPYGHDTMIIAEIVRLCFTADVFRYE